MKETNILDILIVTYLSCLLTVKQITVLIQIWKTEVKV